MFLLGTGTSAAQIPDTTYVAVNLAWPTSGLVTVLVFVAITSLRIFAFGCGPIRDLIVLRTVRFSTLRVFVVLIGGPSTYRWRPLQKCQSIKIGRETNGEELNEKDKTL